jgi:hypothetical protein
LAVPKRKAEFLGLKNLDVLPISQDIAADYFNVYECPDILTQGKSSFLIGGSSNLKSGVDIKIELVNQESDEVIYTQPIMGHSEGGLRRVSIEVYDDTTPGLYTLYIVGELNPDNVNVPQEWQGIYNVRWQKSITVNSMGVNTQPILFYKQPSINVSELFTNFVEIPSGSVTNIYLTGSGEPRQGLTPIAPVENMTEGGAGVASYPDLDFSNKAKLSIVEENKPLVKLSGKHGLIGAQGQQVQTMSPVPNDYTITVSGNSTVDSLYVGQDFTLNDPQVDTSKFTLESYHSVPTAYTSSVMKVLNKTTFVPKDVFYVYDTRTDPVTLVPAPFASTYPISASYLPLPTQTPSTINKLSFADIQVKDLKTFSGDVHTLKIYAKSEGSLGDFELIYNSPVESFQVLHDKTAETLLTNMGYFLDTTRLNNYWESYQGKDASSSGTLTYDATYINDSMKISGSNKEYGDTLRVQNKTAVDFIKGNLYSFRAKVYGIKKDKKDIDGNTSPDASFKVLVKGDAFNKEETTAAHWGDEKLSIPNMPDAVTEYNFGIVEGSFLADNTGTGYIQFQVDSGEWYVSDISLKAATDTAFNPDYVNLKAPVPPLLQRPDRVRFLVEFYDVNNNIADSVIFSEPFTFTGPNINIGGTDNILSGSMYIGNALAAGIEMAGVSSAFVRSMGYQGFSSGSGKGNNAGDGTYSGFLMWSGSVLSDSGDDYKGVGLELVGNSGSYLKFRTDPSELDIRADSFFVGNENAQYVSGSGGQIEISSSNFHLSASGDVNMTGTITATAGEIGDWKIVDGKLSGSNATLDAVGAALHHTTKGPGSDSPPGGFHQLRDEYYIDFTPSQGATATAGKYYIKMGPNFSVSESGILFASGAVFEGTVTASAGFIGGASIESASLAYEPYWRISSSADTSDPVSFISSSNFKVSADGDVTGSDVRFTGGRIANWIIDGHLLKSLGVGGVRLNGNEGGAEISVGTHTFGNGPGIQLHYNSGNPQFFAGTSGNYIKYTVADGVDIQTTKFVLDSDNFDVTADGQITGSQVLFTGGKIAGWDITTTRINSPDGDMRFTSSNPKITIGTHTIGNGPGIQLGYDSGNTLTFFAGQSATDYIKYTAGVGVDIKTGKLELDATNIEISSTHASMSLGEGKIDLVGGSTSYIQVGSANAITLKDDGTDRFLAIGSKTSFSHFDQSTAGVILGTDGGTTKFELAGSSTNYLSFDGTNFDIKLSEGLELDATNIEISSLNASMSIGETSTGGKAIVLEGASTSGKVLVGSETNKQVEIFGNHAKGYIRTGKTSVGDTTEGFWFANNNANPEFHIGDATNFIKLASANLEVATNQLEVSASTIQLSTANASMSLGHSTTYPRGRIILEGAGTPTFTAGTDASWISMSTGSGVYIDGDGNFRFGDDDGNVSFENGSFSITGSDVDINVTDINITANGFQLSSNQASMSLGTNEQWKAYGGSANPYMSIGMGGSGSYGSDGLWLAYNDTLGKPRVSFVGSTGHFKFTGTDLDIKTGTLALAASNIQLSSAQASMSLGGVPGAAANILLDGANSKIEVGSANKVTIQGGTTDNYMVMGSKSSFTHFDQSTQGIIIGMDSTVPKFELAGSATNYISYDGSNFDIKLSQGLELAATNIQLSSAQASMSLGGVPGALANITLDGGNSKIQVGATGSNSITLQGGTADNYMVMGSKSSFSHEGSGTAGIIIGMDADNPQAEFVKSSTNYFIFDGSSGVDIQTTNFELDANTGDLQLSSAHKSMSLGDGKIILQGAATPYIQVGSSNPITIKTDGTDQYIVMGSKTSFTHYDKSTAGIIMGMDTAVPKVEMVKNSSDYFRWDSTDGLDITTTKMEVSASNVQISSTQASMSIGVSGSSAGAIILQSIGDDRTLRFGRKSDFAQTSTSGLIMGMNNGTPEFDFTIDSSNYFRIKSQVQISTDNFTLDTDRMKITTNAGNERIRIFSGSDSDGGRITGAGEFIRLGEVSDDASDLYGLKIYDGTGTGSADTLVKLGQDGNTIAGWNIDNERFYGGDMIIRKDGTIESSGFASSVAGSGFRLTADLGGFLEVENARIRGTLATAVFEKESVNAVGGQLYVANSTTLTGSAFPTVEAPAGVTGGAYTPTETTMSVVNVTGFVANEILSLKKIHSSGFSTEYVKISSASRQNPSSETDFSGQLYVTRGYGSGVAGDSGSLGDTPGAASTYTGSQVIVSTGRYISGTGDNTVGSGYIRLNANPADPYTPYMDIVERTGSGIYDVALKARLGDLSGLSSGLLHGNTSPGHGLFTENVFLQGAITAVTGSITGRLWVKTSDSQYLVLGRDIPNPASDTNDGIYINANNYWYTTGALNVGSATYYLRNDASGNITLQPKTFELDVDPTLSGLSAHDLQISSTEKSMSFSDGDIIFHATTIGGSGAGFARIGRNTSKAIFITGSNTEGVIKSGKNSVTDTTAGFWIANTDGDQEFVVGDSTDYIRYSGSSVNIETRAFELDANTGDLQLSSTQRSMSLSDGKIVLSGSTSPFIQIGNSANYSIKLQTDGTDQFMTMGSKTSFSHEGSGTGGILIGMDNDNPQAEFVSDDLQTYFIFDGDSGVDVKTTAFELAANTDDLQISSTQKSMSLASSKILLDGGGNFGYIRVGGSTSAAGAVHISGSATTGIIRAGKSAYTDTVQAGWILEKTATDSKFYVGDSNDGSFIKFDSDTGIDIGTQKFELAAGTDDLQISSGEKSMSLAGGNVLMDGSQTAGYIRIGSAAARYNNINISGSNTLAVIKAGFTGSYADGVSTGDNGFILERNLTSTKFHVGSGTEYIRFDGTNIDISAANFNLTASNVNITAGDGMEVDAPHFELSTTQTSMSLGYDTNSGRGINLYGGANANYIKLGSKSSPPLQLYTGVGDSGTGTDNYLSIAGKSFASSSSAGIILGSDNGVYKLEMYKDGDEYFKFTTGTDGLDVRTTKLRLKTAGLTISGSDTTAGNNKIMLGSATSVDAGEGFFVDGDGNFRIGDATSGGTNYMKFSSGGSLTIKSDDIDITSTTFSLTANTDDLEISSTEKSMSLAAGKIVLEGASTNGSLKIGGVASVTDTGGSNKGFYAEGSGDFIAKAAANKYIQFKSGNLDIKTDELQIDASNFELSSNEASMSLGEGKIKMVGASTSYITVGTANAITFKDDGTDRFMVIGSKTSFTHFDQSTAGVIFGTDGGTTKFEVVGDTSNYISFNGAAFDIKSQTFDLNTNNIKLRSHQNSGMLSLGGTPNYDVSGSNSGIYMDGTGDFLAYGDGDNFLKKDGTSLTISAETFDLNAGDGKLILNNTQPELKLGHSNARLTLGETANTSISGTNKGIYMDGGGDFLLYGSATNYFKFDASGTSLDVKTDTFDLSTTNLRVSSSYGGTIAMGATVPTSISGSGVFLSGSGEFLVGSHSGNKIQFSPGGSKILMQSNTFALNATTIIIDSSTNSGTIRLGGSGGPSAVDANTKGIYMDGTGDFQVYGDADNYLRFDISDKLELKAENFELDTAGLDIIGSSGTAASNKIIIGGVNADVDGTTQGIYMDGGGDFLAYGDGDNFIKKDGAALTLKSETFTLDAGELYITDAASAGTIGLGSDGSAMSMTVGTGFYANGGGDFRVGREKGVGISFDASEGQLIMSSSTFLMGVSGSAPTTGAYISGSNGNIEVSSSNFHLKSEGDIVAAAIFLDSVALADYFTFRTVIVNTTTYASYVTSYSENSKTWWELVLDSSLGGDAGHMVRLDALSGLGTGNYFPFATIRPPSQRNYAGSYGATTYLAQPPLSGQGAGHVVYTEAANYTVAFGFNNSNFVDSGGGSDTDAFGFYADSDDYHFPLFKSNVVYSGTDYSTQKLMLNESGGRIQWVKSHGFDFRPMGISSYAGVGAPLFDEGLIINNAGDIGSVSSPDAMSISSGGTISGDFNDTSDIALKHNIRGFDNGMDLVRALNPVLFDWKKDGKGTARGFIAQEVEKVIPEVVRGEEGKKSISMMGVVSSLTKAVQELIEENKTMKSAMNDLLSRDKPSSPAHGGLQNRDKLGKRIDGKTLDDYWKDKLK